MANKVQRANKNAKKQKGQFKKSSHCKTDYRRDCEAAKQHKARKHATVAAEG